MGLHNEESEGQNILKGNVKRIVSGLLSALTVFSAFLQPVGVYAAVPETVAYEAEYPAFEKVKEKLDADEIVAAEDHIVEIDSGFDVEHDFSGIEFSPDKVKITFYEATDKDGKKIDIGKGGTYKAVYFVEPASKNPSYHVSRNIIVKEKISVSSSEKRTADGEGSENSHSDDSEGTEADGEGDLPGQTADGEEIPKESMTESEMEAVIEGMEQAEDTRQDAEMIAEEEGILLFAEARQTARASGSATMVKGRKIYYPGNLGNYSTCYFTVNGKIAYCLESAKGSPDTGSYAAQIIDGNPNLQKTLYYGYGGTGDVTASYMPSFGEDLKYVFTHIAASYFYCGMDGFAGCTMDDLRECGVLGWINYLESLPAPPDPQISLSKTALKATYDGSKQVTGTTKLNGDSRNSITIKLPKDVTFHNKTDGSKQTGGTVRVSGGTSFYFTAPVTVNGDWNTGAMKGSIRVIWKALVVPTGSATQDIGSYYEEEGGNSVSLSVDWLERAKVKVIKVDSIANANLSGAVFGIYRDKDCTDLITRMPATDSNGASEAEIVMTQNTVYLKEITAPAGYRYNATSYRVTLEANQTASTTVPDVEQLGNLTIYKEGEVLTGADSNENGTAFRYESRRQKGAVFNVYAAKDITTPYGSVVYKAGDLVAENLVTGDNGSVTLKNLHLGTYRVKEMQAPKNFYNKGETKDVAITYAGQMAEAAFANATFLNDRQKADVRVVKNDKDTENGLAGGIFGLYASELNMLLAYWWIRW